jgi:hypothetical protein
MARSAATFDPYTVLGALERNYVDYVLIGGLARVIRGADQVTEGVDICPSFAANNLDRLQGAAEALGAKRVDRRPLELTDDALGAVAVISMDTSAGKFQVISSPAGAPKGYVDLRRAATAEHLGQGVQPLVASTGDLARMAAALHRDADLQRLPELRRILELEVDRERKLGAVPQQKRPATRRAVQRRPRLGR